MDIDSSNRPADAFEFGLSGQRSRIRRVFCMQIIPFEIPSQESLYNVGVTRR
jgi:hypothetical protein